MTAKQETTRRGPVWRNQPPGCLPQIVHWPSPHMDRTIERRWDRWHSAQQRAMPHRRFVPDGPFGTRLVKALAA